MASDASATQANRRYLLGDSPAEIRHLVEQAEAYSAEAEELVDRIDLPAGARALDIGCDRAVTSRASIESRGWSRPGAGSPPSGA